MKNRNHTFHSLIAAASAVVLASTPAFAGDKHKKAKAEKHKTDTYAMVKQEASDAWLDGKLETTLLFNENLNSFDIDTKVKNGTAWLKGSVESDIDRDLAEEVAKSIEGIDEVRNELTVDAKAKEKAKQSKDFAADWEWREAIMNATLTAKVKSKLLMNEHTSGLDINVDSAQGVVTLTGEVDSEQEADLAEQIAANTEDAREVNNRLMVSEKRSS